MKIITTETLSQLSAEARKNPRKRKNLNLHLSDDFCSHRLFNAIEPGSYIPPHRHLDPNKDETFVIVSGALGVLMFNDDGTIDSSVVLTVGGPAIAVDIPHGRFHGAVSLAPGTVFFEAKAGPYRPLLPEEQAGWAPQADSSDSCQYLAMLTAHLLE
ncbi:WbuC family cupin fold metalloprotein [Geobacter pelophilus]|uniref:WbuC family cupin fold metalloprotein n=1 Tax=Geoanaerobacter pelophilus TaxID=60036 RepID=A0AAW4L9L7_9BACT|nr:WbuC family cupin fold metalloprotein [Geoanaerobacter pelophilus]MBT0665245.1 WbuC family cupin fold metalloprotein [Geoanaerobacter pelophilus]